MKSYVIDFLNESEIRDSIEKEFNRHDVSFEFVLGVDSIKLSVDDVTKHCDAEYVASLKYSSTPIYDRLACWLSHYKVWQTALNSHDSVFAIFEDDVELTSETKRALSMLNTCMSKETDVDIVFLYDGTPREHFDLEFRIEDLRTWEVIFYDSSGSTGYVITKKAITTILNNFPRMEMDIDHLLHAHWLHGLSIYQFAPRVVFRRAEDFL